jgi:hypothetical protein
MKTFLEFICEYSLHDGHYIKTGNIVTIQHPKHGEVTGEVTNHSRKHFEVTHYQEHNGKEVTSHWDRKTEEHIKDEEA